MQLNNFLLSVVMPPTRVNNSFMINPMPMIKDD